MTKYLRSRIWIALFTLLIFMVLPWSSLCADAAYSISVSEETENAVFTVTYTGSVSALSITSPSGVVYNETNTGSAYKKSEGKIQIGVYVAEAGRWKIYVTGNPDDGFSTVVSNDASYGSFAGAAPPPTEETTVAPTLTPTPTPTPTSTPTPSPTKTPAPTLVPTETTAAPQPMNTKPIPTPSEETRETKIIPTTEPSQETTMPSESQTIPSDTTDPESTVENTPIMGIADEEEPPSDQNGGIHIPILDAIFVPTKENPFDLKLWIFISAGSGILIGTLSGVYIRGKKIQRLKRKSSTQYATEIKISDDGKIVL